MARPFADVVLRMINSVSGRSITSHNEKEPQICLEQSEPEEQTIGRIYIFSDLGLLALALSVSIPIHFNGMSGNTANTTSPLGVSPPTRAKYQIKLPSDSRLQLGLNQTLLDYLKARIALATARHPIITLRQQQNKNKARPSPHPKLSALLDDPAFHPLNGFPVQDMIAAARFALKLLRKAVKPLKSHSLIEEREFVAWETTISGWEDRRKGEPGVGDVRNLIVELVTERKLVENEVKRMGGLRGRTTWRRGSMGSGEVGCMGEVPGVKAVWALRVSRTSNG
ncbi:hypothetical protein LTR27_005535 [Elasticomyces elasticus]|nr:hypothetical protein LTR27_005535 [Elasticomyces elasticus]